MVFVISGNATLEPWKLGCFAPAKALLIYFRLIRRNYGLFNAITFCVAQKSNQTGMLTWEKFDEVDVQERGATGRILWERTVLFGENKIGNVFTSCSENNLLFWGDDLNKGVHIFNIPDGSIVESIMTDAPVCGLKVYNEGTRVEVLESDECNDPSGSKSNIWVYRRTIYWYNDRHQPKETYEPKGTKEHQTRRIEEVDWLC